VLSIEDYIAYRKKEENIDEFDLAERQNNIKLCLDFILEYFNSYLDSAVDAGKIDIKNERSGGCQNQLRNYERSVLEWLEGYYSE
jgi:hypothetical protein